MVGNEPDANRERGAIAKHGLDRRVEGRIGQAGLLRFEGRRRGP